MDNSEKDRTELIYEISGKLREKCLQKHEGREIKDVLFRLEGVEAVHLVCQNDEITR